MYYYRAILKYFCDVNMFNIGFCAFVILLSGFFWGVVMFSTIGIIIGRYGFKTFKNDEYYLYHNLGLSKTSLLYKVFLMNLCISLPLMFLNLIF